MARALKFGCEQPIRAISLSMAKRQAASDRGHPFPAPMWWMKAIGKVRDSMTDQALIDAIEAQTGRTYSKFTISRYFTEDNPTTTLELTSDLWLTFGEKHGIPRPVFVAETRADAERYGSSDGDRTENGGGSPGADDSSLRRDMGKFESRLKKDERAGQPSVLQPAGGEDAKQPGSPTHRGRPDHGRRR